MPRRPLTCFFFLLSFLLLISACQPAGGETPVQTPPAVDTVIPTETPTIVWFPPTDTPTVAPTLAPTATPNELPGVTDVIFSDDFSDPSHWQISTAAQAASIIEGLDYSLAILRRQAIKPAYQLVQQ